MITAQRIADTIGVEAGPSQVDIRDLITETKKKLKGYVKYLSILNNGDYDPLANRLIYKWGSISVVYNKMEGFEQESYKVMLSANLRNK